MNNQKGYVHVTKEGDMIPLSELTDSHLLNIIRYIRRRAKEGVDVIYGGGGGITENMWGDFDTIFGKEVKELMNLKAYKAEAKRRGLNTKQKKHG